VSAYIGYLPNVTCLRLSPGEDRIRHGFLLHPLPGVPDDGKEILSDVSLRFF